ncbi:VIT1/CCC1 transporter family protein [Aeromonas taiwanensis]|uniref:VIT1/CCC1 transporter family protein n=1 Tax=Aeromonas taiwanensis TaxID=633417 RepID=UPI00248DE0E1|nr:VIT1/CCC1 transporter family protein [Aeromonas taiwanensis]
MIDAIVYLITTLTERARALRLLQQLNQLQPGDDRGVAALRDALPGPLAAICRDDELGDWQARLRLRPELSQGPIFRWNDLLNSLGVFLMVFLSTFPVLLPFMFMQDPVPALRLSHAIALLMLLLIGRGLARYAGSPRPLLIGVLFAVAGVAIVLATIALGG